MNRGLEETRAWKSARNGLGAWWSAGASHMHAVYTTLDLDRLGLVRYLTQYSNLKINREPPYPAWGGTFGGVRGRRGPALPYSITPLGNVTFERRCRLKRDYRLN